MKKVDEKYTYEEIFNDKQNILIVTGHPDDTIVYFGALTYKLRKDNKNIYVLVVSNGGRGSRQNDIPEQQLAQKRQQEEKDAMKILGVNEKNLFFLNYNDGEIESNLKLIGQITYFIRKYKADMVCSHEPSIQYQHTYDNNGFFVQHRDHRKVGEAVIDASYPFSRDRSFFPKQYKDGIEPHSVYDLLLTDEVTCNFDLDYTDNLEIKKSAYRAHKSQFPTEELIQEWVDGVKFNDRYFERFRYLKLLW